ncbi:MAG TPA: glycosyl transferase family protein [Micropepsaceae bacterium]|nr:glycosyl transferase family protein [Micropepsaceae bacterium]
METAFAEVMAFLQEVVAYVTSSEMGRDLHAVMAEYWAPLQFLIMVVACGILVSSLDDFFLDLQYWEIRLSRVFSARGTRVTTRKILAHPEKLTAVLVPAWQESDVIAKMLINSMTTFDYKNVHFFVGTYRNDPETGIEVDRVRQRFPNVHRAEVGNDGPSSKADCLNWVIQQIFLYEEEHGVKFDMFVMHDSEDVVHRLGLKVMNWFIDTAGMVQLPVLSMNRRWTQLVACHYMDEFAEWHGKDLVVRSANSGMTPSAGVATAFSREAMLHLCQGRNNMPFNTDSLTEDYDVGHRLKEAGFRTRFVRFWAEVPHWKKRWFSKRLKETTRTELVATREHFPEKIKTSMRQKARWMLGISYMGWQQIGWYGDLKNRYFLYRDRKALITAPMAMLAYLIVIQYALYWLLVWVLPGFGYLPPLVDRDWVWTVIYINFFFLVVRLLHRAWFVGRTHGARFAVLSPVRAVISNYVSFLAFVRSMRLFVTASILRRKIVWDKTEHTYPSLAEIKQGRHRLGDILAFTAGVKTADAEAAASEQENTYRPFGLLMLDKGVISDEQLAQAFAEQFGTVWESFDPLTIDRRILKKIPRETAARFLVYPLRKSGDELTIAVAEPLSRNDRMALEKTILNGDVKKLKFVYAPRSDVMFAIRYGYQPDAFEAERSTIDLLRKLALMNQSQERDLWRAIRKRYLGLGDLLVRRRAIGHRALVDAVDDFWNSGEGRNLGEYLVAKRLVSRQTLKTALAAQLGSPVDVVKMATELGIIRDVDAALVADAARNDNAAAQAAG